MFTSWHHKFIIPVKCSWDKCKSSKIPDILIKFVVNIFKTP